MRPLLYCIFAAAAIFTAGPALAQPGIEAGAAPLAEGPAAGASGAPGQAQADALEAGAGPAAGTADQARELESTPADSRAADRPDQGEMAARAEFDALKPQVDALERALKDSKKEIARLARENKKLLEREAAAAKELKAARERTASSIAEELKMKLDSSEKRVADLERQIKTGEEIRADGEKMRQRMAELANQVKANANRQALEEELASIRQKNEAVEKALKDSYADRQQCLKDLAEMNKAHDELANQLAAERGRNKDALDKESGALKAAEQAAASLKARMKALEKELKDARWAADRYLEQFKIASRERAQLEARLARESVLRDLSPASRPGVAAPHPGKPGGR